MMLSHLGEEAAADSVEKALAAVLADGSVRTPDLGGQATTSALGEAIATAVSS
jgi:tartrate dehydrogenase/decarboxylase / D-malate dehydrogenase